MAGGVAVKRPVSKLIVHHSATPRSATFEQLERGHRERGFEGIGYHLVILGDGSVRRGRDFEAIGAHALGANEDSLGICVVGDNTRPEHAWTEEQCRALRAVVATLCAALGRAIPVHPHSGQGYTRTACPGLSAAQLEKVLT